MSLTIPGVDFAWQHPSISSLKANGVRFVMRYISHDPGKDLTVHELSALWDAGIAVGVVFETTANRALSGLEGGAIDARFAEDRVKALGLEGIPIYFGVDWDVTPAQKPTVAAYLHGAASVVGHTRVGVYGGYWVIKYCAEHDAAHWLWQTYAWSGGLVWKLRTLLRALNPLSSVVHDHAHIYQWRNAISMGGAQLDLDKAGDGPDGYGCRLRKDPPPPAEGIGTCCGDVDGCWAQDAVNIGWYGYRCTSVANVRVGPGLQFPSRGIIEEGKRVGWQSVRNPRALNGPEPRGVYVDAEERPWAWVYKLDGGLTGWFPATHLEPHDTGGPWARGPAGEDFHVGYDECVRGKPYGCGGHRTSGETRVVQASDLYLRYAAHSTAYYLLQAGDKVREMYRSPNGYSCVQVLQSTSARVAARGWVGTEWIK